MAACSVIALSKVYELEDARLSQIHVKGDLIPSSDTRIMTRSRARQNPDQYTIIPASLKIVKVLVEELLSPVGGNAGDLDPKSAAALNGGDDNDEESDDGEWEDEPNDFLDLGLGTTKAELMAYGEGNISGLPRGRDDETQAYLVEWFTAQANKQGFVQTFEALSQREQDKLRAMAT